MWIVNLTLFLLVVLLFTLDRVRNSTTYEGFEYSSKLSVKDIENLKKGQAIMTRMLKDFDAICIKNNITYFIFAGNLIGQRLYGGWIPWDADVDLYVAEKDYNKLKNVLVNTPLKNTWYQTLETDRHYLRPIGALPIGKIHDLTSCYKKCQDGTKWHNGLQIDLNTYKVVNNKIVFNTRNPGELRIEKGISLPDIFPLKRVKYDNIVVNSPQNPDKMLDLHYGKKWREIPPISSRYPHEGRIDPNNTCEHHYKMYPNLYPSR